MYLFLESIQWLQWKASIYQQIKYMHSKTNTSGNVFLPQEHKAVILFWWLSSVFLRKSTRVRFETPTFRRTERRRSRREIWRCFKWEARMSSTWLKVKDRSTNLWAHTHSHTHTLLETQSKCLCLAWSSTNQVKHRPSRCRFAKKKKTTFFFAVSVG